MTVFLPLEKIHICEMIKCEIIKRHIALQSLSPIYQAIILKQNFLFSHFWIAHVVYNSSKAEGNNGQIFCEAAQRDAETQSVGRWREAWWGPLCQANNLHAAQFPQQCLTKAVPASWLCTCSVSLGDPPQGRCVDGRAFRAQVGTEHLYRWLSRLQSENK